jgi:hypothetical protein
MPKFCSTCGRHAHKGLCDMATLSDGRSVHVSRLDSVKGDVKQEIDAGKVKVTNRWIKPKPKKKKTARKS